MNWCINSGLRLFPPLTDSKWMLRGRATRSWLVFPFVPYCPRSLCAFNLLRVLVHHSQWDVPSVFVLLHQLGKITRELQRGIRRTRRREGPFFAPGIKAFIGEFAWQRWIVTLATLIRNFQC